MPGYDKGAYGDFLVYITTGGEVLGLLNGFREGKVKLLDDFISPPKGSINIFRAVHPSGLPLQIPRLLLSLINSLAPLIIFYILRRRLHTDPFSAFGGGLIYAIFSRDVLYYSSFILPDALATTLFLGALAFAWKGMEDERGKVTPYLLSGMLSGMVVSVAICDLFVIIIPFLAVLFGKFKNNWPFKFFYLIKPCSWVYYYFPICYS